MPHDRLEGRSLALHRAIADKLRHHPELLAVAHNNLDRWSAANGRSKPYFDTWRALSHRPLPELLAVMEEASPRSQTSRPAFGISFSKTSRLIPPRQPEDPRCGG